MKRMFYTLRTLLYPVGGMLFPCKIMDKDKFKKYEFGRMIISNHLSWMDPLYQMFRIPEYKRFLSKKENDGGKLKHWFLRNVGIIFIDREKPELSSMRECIAALKNGETLTIFPEGTRNRINRELQPMHSGAAMIALKGNATVIPIAVHHKGKVFRRNYMGVGDPVELGDLMGKRIDENILNEATERFAAAIQATLEKLDEWVKNKGWKADKKVKKQAKKALKAEYKAAKKSAAKAAKNNG